MAKHLKDLLSSDRIAGCRRRFSIPDDVRLSLLADGTLDIEREDETTIVFPLLSIAEGGVRFLLHPFLRAVLRHWDLIPSQPNVNFFRIIMGIVALNCHLGINLGILAIRHCYALAKSSGRQGRYFLRAKDTDHQLITMLSNSGKRVDDVMVVVQGNWEFGEGEDRVDPVPRRRGEPGRRVSSCFCHVFIFIVKPIPLKSYGFVSCRKGFEKDTTFNPRRRSFRYQGCSQVFRPSKSSEAGEGGSHSALLRADIHNLLGGGKHTDSEG